MTTHLRIWTALAAALLLTWAQGATLVVCPQECNYTSIQSAIDSASAGDVIQVKNGTYYEHLYVNKGDIVLMGVEGDRRPLIDGNDSGSVITISANGVTLDNFAVTNSGHCGCGSSGIKVISDNNTVTHNVAYGNRYGIYVSGSDNMFYANDLFENTDNVRSSGNNTWDLGDSDPIKSLLGRVGLVERGGNHYDDYDEPAEGCLDDNGDGLCDQGLNITEGSGVDRFPLVHP